jgi:drug/metabolite transporter (DMT)-like permease
LYDVCNWRFSVISDIILTLSIAVLDSCMEKTFAAGSDQQGLSSIGERSLPETVTLSPQKPSEPSMPSRKEYWSIGLALFALYFIWGANFLCMRIALESFPPFIMAGFRFTVAGGSLYIFLRLRRSPAPTRGQWLGAALIGLLLIAVCNGGISFAEQSIASGLAAVMVAAIPLWTALFIGLQGRWPTRLECVGLVLGFAGVILLNLEHGIWANPVGAMMLLLSPIAWGLGSALSTRVSLPEGLMSSASQMLIGGVLLLTLALLSGERVAHLPSLSSWAALAFMIIFSSIITFSAYIYLLRRVRPALATSYAYVNPIVAVALGVGLANEHITLIGILAMLVILTGVGLVSLQKRKY